MPTRQLIFDGNARIRLQKAGVKSAFPRRFREGGDPEKQRKRSKMRRTSHLAVLCVAILLAAITQRADAAIIITPPSLMPGDQYRLVFVTSGSRNAESANIDDYNSFVDEFGDDAIASDWKAIASTPTVSARDNTNTIPGTDGTGIPIYNLMGDPITNSYANLWDGGIFAPINIDQTGAIIAAYVFTGTDPGGFPAFGGALSSPDDDAVVLGDTTKSIYSGWIDDDLAGTWEEFRMYGISGVLTVPQPVPEPSSAIAMGLLVGIGFAGRRLRRRQPEAA